MSHDVSHASGRVHTTTSALYAPSRQLDLRGDVRGVGGDAGNTAMPITAMMAISQTCGQRRATNSVMIDPDRFCRQLRAPFRGDHEGQRED